jgi:hypothetical protein
LTPVLAVLKPVPMSALSFAAKYLQPYVHIMYGEACSAVPLYKAKKSKY